MTKTPVAGAPHVASLPSGLVYFRAPIGTKAGDMVHVQLPENFDDGTTWGDNAAPAVQPPQDQWARPRGDIPGATGRVEVADVLDSSEWTAVDMSTRAGPLSRVRQIKSSGHPPMMVVTASQLRRLKRLPRSSEGVAEDLETLLERHGVETKHSGPFRELSKTVETDKSSVAVVMFSHTWFRPTGDKTHPDDAAGRKVNLKGIVI